MIREIKTIKNVCHHYEVFQKLHLIFYLKYFFYFFNFSHTHTRARARDDINPKKIDFFQEDTSISGTIYRLQQKIVS